MIFSNFFKLLIVSHFIKFELVPEETASDVYPWPDEVNASSYSDGPDLFDSFIKTQPVFGQNMTSDQGRLHPSVIREYFNSLYGTDSDGNVVTGGDLTSSGLYDILDTSNSSYNDYYTFTINSTYTGISSGCYYYYDKSTSTQSSCYSLTSGTKSYGTPRAYRIISDNDEEKIAMNQTSTRITAEDIKAYKRYQHLLRIHNSTDKEPLKRFLHSFRTN